MPHYKPIRRDETVDTRPPEVQLEEVMRAATRQRARRVYGRICERLALDRNPAPWIAAARSLRDRGIISENVFYYLVDQLTARLVPAPPIPDSEIMRVSVELGLIKRPRDLGDGAGFNTELAPAERAAAILAWYRQAREAAADYCRTHGHLDVASLMESDADEFDRRSDAGCDELWRASDQVDEE
jgi:hypothetical protein